MALTKDFRETVMEMAQQEPEFRTGLLKEAINCFLNGEINVGKGLLRDYINATIGFQGLAEEVDKSPKSLMRMFGPTGNPRADNFFQIISYLQKKEGLQLKV